MEGIRSQLLALQNPDGGWGFSPGHSSWTEPTALAMLALQGSDPANSHLRRGLEWLRRLVRADGGVAVSPQVQESSWVTALAVLVELRLGQLAKDDQRLRWLLQRSGRESEPFGRWVRRLRGLTWEGGDSYPGWPWVADTTAWVTPTAWSLIALRNAGATLANGAIGERLQQGQKFLLSRQCADGGWNYGAARALGVDAVSYPETTGIALLALRGTSVDLLAPALRRAEQMVPACKSTHATSWLCLGLAAHDRHSEVPGAPRRVPTDLAIYILAEEARKGKFLV